MDSLDLDNLQVTDTDLLNILNKFRIKYDAIEVKKIIRKSWCLEQAKNSNKYDKITITNDLDFFTNSAKGRYFNISRNFLTYFLMN